MAIPQQAETGDFKQMRYDTGKLAALLDVSALSSRDQGQDTALRINNVLQTTLEVDKVIEIFAHEVKTLVPHSSVIYNCSPYDIVVNIGRNGRHSCSYSLVVTDQSLGELTFTSKKKFTANDTKEIENLLCGLVYPLRNALLYHRALEAALKDPLTGINNRTSMDSTIVREIDLARRHNTPLSLIAVDIDHFKKINDTYGHIAGDRVLRSLTNTLMASVRSTDMVFRYGGEEFTVLLTNTGQKGAVLLAERIRRNVKKTPHALDKKIVTTTVSLGVACLTPADNSQSLFARADEALYEAKTNGRDRAKVAPLTAPKIQ